jgi:predicted NUDIX family phosphoesterase
MYDGKDYEKTMSKMDEMVAVFPASLLANYTKSGYYKFHTRMIDAVLKHITFQRRGNIEEDVSWRQLIPYVYIYNKEGALLAYRRTAAGMEHRLHAKVSVGFGGHINKEDASDDPDLLLQNAGYRELLEELSFSPTLTRQLVPAGFIVGHESLVDKVHFGVALALSYTGTVTAHDSECEILGWRRRVDLLHEPHLENWSKKLLTEFGR